MIPKRKKIQKSYPVGNSFFQNIKVFRTLQCHVHCFAAHIQLRHDFARNNDDTKLIRTVDTHKCFILLFIWFQNVALTVIIIIYYTWNTFSSTQAAEVVNEWLEEQHLIDICGPVNEDLIIKVLGRRKKLHGWRIRNLENTARFVFLEDFFELRENIF